MKLLNKLRAMILGVEVNKLEAIQNLLNGYQPPSGRHNSIIIGGPTSWSWQATLDDTHHGSRGSGLHADSHNQQHAMDSSSDHSAGTAGDLIRAGSGGVWQRLSVGSSGQVLTVVSGLPAWADAPAGGVHGNELHDPDFYPVDGTQELTAPLWMQLMSPTNEPSASAGNEGKLYYLTPNSGNPGLLKQVMKNSTGSFELVQVSIST
jgi:hypothetical protein